MNYQLCNVKSVTTNYQNRKILILDVNVELVDGGGLSVFNVVLDTYDKEKQKRVGTSYGCDMTKACLDFFGVNNLSEVKNYKCYLITEKEFIRNVSDVLGLKQLPFYEYEGNLQEIIKADVLKEFTIE